MWPWLIPVTSFVHQSGLTGKWCQAERFVSEKLDSQNPPYSPLGKWKFGLMGDQSHLPDGRQPLWSWSWGWNHDALLSNHQHLWRTNHLREKHVPSLKGLLDLAHVSEWCLLAPGDHGLVRWWLVRSGVLLSALVGLTSEMLSWMIITASLCYGFIMAKEKS